MRRAWVLLPVVLLGLGGCAGYQIGNQSLYPSNIHTVYVPTFESASFRRDLGPRLTEAIVKEIELKTPYKVVATPDADSVLTGYLVNEGKRIVAQDRYGDPRQVEVRLQLEVNWIDRRGQVVREFDAVALPPSAVAVNSTDDVLPEVGQSVATTQQEAIQEVAEQIVGMMEAPW